MLHLVLRSRSGEQDVVHWFLSSNRHYSVIVLSWSVGTLALPGRRVVRKERRNDALTRNAGSAAGHGAERCP